MDHSIRLRVSSTVCAALFPRKQGRAAGALFRAYFTVRLVQAEPLEGRTDGVGVVGIDQIGGLSGDFRERGTIRGEHGGSAGHRLENGQSETFPQRDERQDIGALQKRGDVGLGDVAREMDSFRGRAGLGGFVDIPFHPSGVSRQHQVVGALGLAFDQLAVGPNKCGQVFSRLDPAYVQDEAWRQVIAATDLSQRVFVRRREEARGAAMERDRGLGGVYTIVTHEVVLCALAHRDEAVRGACGVTRLEAHKGAFGPREMCREIEKSQVVHYGGGGARTGEGHLHHGGEEHVGGLPAEVGAQDTVRPEAARGKDPEFEAIGGRKAGPGRRIEVDADPEVFRQGG